MTDPNLQATAIHEAGHAVACEQLFPSRPTGVLSIVPDPDEGLAGQHESEDAIYLASDSADEADQYSSDNATYLCAGDAALVAAGYE